MTTRLRSTVLTVALLFAGAEAVSAEGLFRPAGAAQGEARALQDAGIPRGLRPLRTALVVADPAYVSSRIAPSGTANLTEDQRELAVNRLPANLNISLFPDVSLRLRREFANAYYGGGVEWAGSSVDFHNCGATLSVERGILSGEVECADLDRSYYISHIDRDLYRVYEVVRPRDRVGYCDTDPP